jgi:hypothetical protein
MTELLPAGPWAALAVFAALVCCYVVIARAVRRRYYSWRGRRIERAAARRLTIRLPLGWTLTKNVPVPGHGDADILLADAQGQRWVVEVKSYESIRRTSWLLRILGRPEVRRASGRFFERDPIAQVVGVADACDARPVLWLPYARGRTFITRSGVIVVQGSSRRLMRAVGGCAWWQFS